MFPQLMEQSVKRKERREEKEGGREGKKKGSSKDHGFVIRKTENPSPKTHPKSTPGSFAHTNRIRKVSPLLITRQPTS